MTERDKAGTTPEGSVAGEAEREKKRSDASGNPRLAAALAKLSEGLEETEDSLDYDVNGKGAGQTLVAGGVNEARAYVPPMTIPPQVHHKTLEMHRVRISPNVDPRKVPTQPRLAYSTPATPPSPEVSRPVAAPPASTRTPPVPADANGGDDDELGGDLKSSPWASEPDLPPVEPGALPSSYAPVPPASSDVDDEPEAPQPPRRKGLRVAVATVIGSAAIAVLLLWLFSPPKAPPRAAASGPPPTAAPAEVEPAPAKTAEPPEQAAAPEATSAPAVPEVTAASLPGPEPAPASTTAPVVAPKRGPKPKPTGPAPSGPSGPRPPPELVE